MQPGRRGHGRAAAGRHLPAARRQEGARLRSWLAGPLQGCPAGGLQVRAAGRLEGCAAARHAAEHAARPAAPRPLAPLMPPPPSPARRTQHLVLVRHGESEYNRADSESRSTQDPHLYDPRLTSRGREQARKLGDKLRGVLARYNTGGRRGGRAGARAGAAARLRARRVAPPGGLPPAVPAAAAVARRAHRRCRRRRAAANDNVLWVVSPLTRAIETLALGCPYPDRLGTAGGGAPQQPLNLAVLRCALSGSAAAAALRGPGRGSGSAAGARTRQRQRCGGHDAAAAALRGPRRGGPGACRQPARPRSAAAAAPVAPAATAWPAHTFACARRRPPAPLPPPPTPPCSCVSEHVATTGDIGRPPAQLAADFPWLAERLAGLPDTWWHTRPGAPNCCAKRQFKSKETMDALRVRARACACLCPLCLPFACLLGCRCCPARLPRPGPTHPTITSATHPATPHPPTPQKRVAEFARFLNSRSEKVIVCIGHSTFWKVFSNDKQRLKNCEVRTMLW